MFLPRELPLLAFQAFAFGGEVERPDRRAVGVVGVLENPHVNTDAILGILRRFGRFTVHLDAEGGEPLARRFLLDRDLFELRVVGDGAVEPNRYVCEFRERQDSLTALLVELEARLTVRETAELPWRLPLELTDAVAVLLEFGESVEVVEQAFYDGLENLRVHVGEAIPPLLQVGDFRPKRGHRRQFAVLVLVLVETVERVVVELSTNIAVAVQLLAMGVGRLEAVLVGVVHQLSRWSSTYCFSTSSDTCPVEMRQYESFQNESPHSSVLSSSAYSLRIRRAVAPLTVLMNFTRSVVGFARKRMCTWSSSPSRFVSSTP